MADDSGTVDIAPVRSVGGVSFQCTIREDHSDELAITQHPVEQGAAITDHAYKQPAVLTIEAGSSNSSPDAAGDPEFVSDLYDTFLGFQTNRELLSVVTGKRLYSNMLVRSLQVTTDKDTEFVLMVRMTLQQVIIVQTKLTTVPDPSSQADPSKTSGVQSTGTVQPSVAANANTAAFPPGIAA
jgi:hypothetical protein